MIYYVTMKFKIFIFYFSKCKRFIRFECVGMGWRKGFELFEFKNWKTNQWNYIEKINIIRYDFKFCYLVLIELIPQNKFAFNGTIIVKWLLRPLRTLNSLDFWNGIFINMGKKKCFSVSIDTTMVCQQV